MARNIVRILGPAGIANPYTHDGSVDPPGTLLRTRGKSWDMVVERPGVPLIDSEINLMQQLNQERIEDFIMSMALPGWLKASGYPASTSFDLTYDSGLNTLGLPDDSWIVANGKMIHVSSGVDTGGIRFAAGSKPTAGTYRRDFVFIEFWRHEISPSPAADSGGGVAGSTYFPTATSPTVSGAEDPNSSRGMTRDQVYVNGGVANGVTHNDLLTDATGTLGDFTGTFGETTRRVQLRWRIRVIEDVNFDTWIFGLGDLDGTGNPGILAQGGMMLDPNGIATYNFEEIPPEEGLGDIYTVNGEVYGKGRLFRAGHGTQTDANALNTVDGYVFALPMFAINMGNTGPTELTTPTAVPAVKDMRQLSHVFIPNHVLHSDQLTTYDDPAQAGVYGAAFEINPDTVLGRTVKSNIRRNSITGGTDGDIAPNSITNYNLVGQTINNTSLVDGTLTINKVNIDAMGLPTVKVYNRSGSTRINGDVVVLERDTLQTYDGFYLATQGTAGNGATIGVVANFLEDGSEASILNGAQGYVRLMGQVAKIAVSGTVARGQYLMVSSVNGKATIADGTQEVFAFSITGGTDTTIRALVFSRVADNSIRTSKLVNGAVTGIKIAPGTITDTNVAGANINGLNAVPSMRTIGSGTGEVVAGNDARLTNTRTPTGTSPASGDLAGSTWANLVIAPNAITTTKIINGAVTNDKIAIEGLQGGQGGVLAQNTITAYNISAHTIQTGHYAPLSVDTAAIGNLQVTDEKIYQVHGSKIIGGTIDSSKFIAGSVDANAIGSNAVTTDKIGFRQVNETKLAQNSVGTLQIQNGVVDTNKLAAGAVQAGQIFSQAVLPGNLADGAIERAAVIASGIIDNTKLAAGAVHTNNIADSALIDRHIGTRYYVEAQTVTPQLVGHNTLTTVNFTGLALDTPNAYLGLGPSWAVGDPTKIYVRRAGLYWVQCIVHVSGGPASWYYKYAVHINGGATPIIYDAKIGNTGIDTTGFEVVASPSNVWAMSANDYIQLRLLYLITPTNGSVNVTKCNLKLFRIGDYQ